MNYWLMFVGIAIAGYFSVKFFPLLMFWFEFLKELRANGDRIEKDDIPLEFIAYLAGLALGVYFFVASFTPAGVSTVGNLFDFLGQHAFGPFDYIDLLILFIVIAVVYYKTKQGTLKDNKLPDFIDKM